MEEDGTDTADLSSAIMENFEACFQKKLSARSEPHGEMMKKREARKLFYKTGGRQSFVGAVF